MSVGPGLLTNRKASINSKGEASYTYKFRVESTIRNENEANVANALGIPAMWESHPTNPNALVKSRSIDQDEGAPRLWTVTVMYDTQPFEVGTTSGEGGGDPTPGATTQQTAPNDRPPVIRYDEQVIEEPMEEDFSDPPKKVVNSAGIPYDPLPTREVTVDVITITDYTTSFDPFAAGLYRGKVNDRPVVVNGFNYDTGRLLCKKFSGTSQFENASGKVWTREAVLWAHPYKQWDTLRLLDAGTVAFKPGVINPIPSQITDDEGNAITQPVPLDGAGAKLDSTDPDDFVWNQFKRYPEIDFIGVFGVAP